MNALRGWRSSLILAGVLAGACGEVPDGAQERELATMHQPLACSATDTTPPALSIQDQDLNYECTGAGNANAWVAPDINSIQAVDACEGPVPVYRYNTGDDDGDGIPGTIDPDDFGPGPTTEAEGLYYVQYLAWDSSYNIQSATLAVHVQDTLEPVLTLSGNDSVQTQCFTPTHDPTKPGSDPEMDPDPYIEQGAQALDQCDGDLSPQVQVFGDVNKQQPGVYTLEYDVGDSASHWAAPITRTVEVVDTLAPKLALLPMKPLPADGAMHTVALSDCAVAWDLCEGYLDISSRAYDLQVTSNDPLGNPSDIVLLGNSAFAVRARLNRNGSPRVYTAQFKVDDSAANTATATFKVYVSSNTSEPPPAP